MNKDLRYFVGGLPPSFPGNLKFGAKGADVKVLQEFLCLAGYNLALDGDYGNGTRRALYRYGGGELGKAFQSNELTRKVWGSLTEGMRLSLRRQKCRRNIYVTVVTYATAHLRAGAAELKASNLGPWVRLYMDGHEGRQFPWCAGFVSFIVKQTAISCGIDIHNVDLPDSMSCDVLAEWGIERRKLITDLTSSTIVHPGSIFLVYRSENDWVHTGIVTAKHGDMIETIEGNTNMAGSREGTTVLRRFRGIKNIHILEKYLPRVNIGRTHES